MREIHVTVILYIPDERIREHIYIVYVRAPILTKVLWYLIFHLLDSIIFGRWVMLYTPPLFLVVHEITIFI